MEHRIRNMLSGMEYDELINVRKEVKKGSLDFTKIVKDMIKEKEKEHKKYCCVCGQDIDPYSTNNFTILFGPEDFKKRASFCAVDCLEYFIIKMKDVKNGKETKIENVEEEDIER